MFKKALKKIIWEKEEYFTFARKAILDGFSHNLAIKRLKEYALNSSGILDCGCGDGTVMELIWNKEADFWGVDLSRLAVNLGQKRLKDKKNVHLLVGDLGELELPEKSFDLVYTHDVLEHLDKPERVIRQMIRVTKKGGHLVFISPNYGSPLYPSPSSQLGSGDLTSRAIKIFLKSHLYLLKKPQGLDWLKVFPVALRRKRWKSDWDTVVEPYLQTLLIFLKEQGAKVEESYSMGKGNASKIEWKFTKKPNLRQKLLSGLKKLALVIGEMGIPPYKYFGPSLFVVGKKKIIKY